jgi:hypothetical protein
VRLNRTHNLLAYADDVNLPGDNVDAVKKNTENLIDASKEIGLEVNARKTKYICAISSPECRSNQDKKIVKRCLKMCHT